MDYSIEKYLELAGKYKFVDSKESSIEGTSDKIIANKYNFIKLDKEIKKKFGISVDIDPFAIFPTQDIIIRWFRYVKEANLRLTKFNKKISLEDAELASLTLRLSKIKNQTPGQKRDLLRALGVICEDVFVGPYLIVTDLLHRCNTNCLHCWIHYPGRTDPGYYDDLKKEMDIKVFSNIAEKAREIGVEKICLLANGEPLMHPGIREIINICCENNLVLETVTNGVFMTESLSRLMVDSGVSSITISLPAATAESYKQICPKSSIEDFEKVKKNTKFLISYKNKMRSNVRVNMTHVIHNLNCCDLFKFVEMDIELGVDTVSFKIILLDNNNYYLKLNENQISFLNLNLPGAIAKLRDKGIYTDDSSSIYLDFYEDRQGLRTKNFFTENGCLTGWSFCNIQLDGEVLFCCGNKMVDSLQESSFDKIWFSEKYNFYRKAAKYMRDNKHVEFARSEKLFDNSCDSCENVNQHLHVVKIIREYSLEDFL